MTQGSYLLAGSIYESTPHLVDLAAKKPFNPLRFQAADVYGKLMASESGKGGVTLGELGAAKVEALELPAPVLPYLRTARFSADGRYLALSNESRGALWDLKTNRQIVLTRSFRAAWFDEDAGMLYLQLTAGQTKAGQNLSLNLKTGAVVETGAYTRDARQYLDLRMDADWLDPQKLKGDSLQAFDTRTGNPVWKRRFPKDYPLLTQDSPGTLVMFWSMDGETAWDEILHSSVVTKTADENREEHQGSLTEIVDSRTGAVSRQIVSPEGALSGWGTEPGSYSTRPDQRFARTYGDLVAIHGNHNNTVVYDAKSGARRIAFWGRPIAGSGELGWIAAINRSQEISVYDVVSGKQLLRATLDLPIAAAQFVLQQRALLVVTKGQRVYTFPLDASHDAPAQQADAH